jgi:GTPase SAR1 family protein
VVNPTSFRNIENKWIRELKHYMPNTPVILVGTKSDLRNNSEILEELKNKGEKPIDQSEAQSLAKKIKAHKYMECSALVRSGVKDVFDQAIISALFPKKKKKRKVCSIL